MIQKPYAISEPANDLALYGRCIETEMIILLVMLLAQAFLIAWLLFERRKRNRVKDALQESEAFLSLAATASNTCLWHWESGSGQIWATDKAQEMFGLSPEGGLDAVRVLAIVHPDDRERLRETVKEALQLGTDTGAEYRIVLPGGSVRWILSRGKVLTVSRGEQVRLVGISIDITDRKAVELQSAQDRAQLEHMDRVTMLGALSASLSHELNQPLTAILTNAQVGQRLSAGLQEEFVELAEIFDDIASEARRAGEYIHSLHGLFKQGKPHIQQFNINELINKVLGLIASELLMRHISLVRDFASQLPTVSADPVQIEQVLLNLVMNAAQAMEASSLEKRELTIRTEASNAGILVFVIDSGEGIPAGQLDTLFEPFVSTKPDGLGVGLMICHSIIRAHRGQLTATNNAEHGATFCFTLPLGTA